MTDSHPTLRIGTVLYTLTLNECADNSPWLGHRVWRNDAISSVTALVEEIREVMDMDEDEADAWLDGELWRLLDEERARVRESEREVA